MTSIILCGLQITIVLFAALWLSRITLRRDPAMSALLGFAGMVSASFLVLLSTTDAPRPFSVQTILESQMNLGRKPILDEPTIWDSRESSLEPHFIRDQALGLNWYSITDSLRKFATRQPADRVEKRTHVVFWCVLVVFGIGFAVRIVIGALAVIVVRRRSKVFKSDDATSWISDWKSASGINIPITVRISTTISSPCVTWLHRGEILVPSSFASWSMSDQRTTLAHELQHIIRRDALFRFIVDLVHLLICIHPLAYRLRRQIVLAQELATDRGAVALLGDWTTYRRGLASLALRFDSIASSSPRVFGVSVYTNDLIRRIKMLSSVSSPLRKWQKVLAVISFVGITASVSLFTSADDAPRIASLSRPGVSIRNVCFQRPPSAPWKNIGLSDSYIRILPASFRVFPDYEQKLDRIASEFMKADSPLPEGFLADNWTLFESDLSMTVKKIDPPSSNGHTWRLLQSIDSLRMEFQQPVNWAVISEDLDWHRFGPHDSEVFARMRSDMSKLDKSNVLDLTRKNSPAPVNVTLAKQIWERIDGGVFGVVWRVDESFTNHEAAEADKSGIVQLLQSCESIGFGLDFDSNVTTAHTQIVLLPRAGKTVEDIKAYLAKVKTAISARRGSGTNDPEPKLRFLLHATVTTETLNGNGPGVVILTGQGNPIDFALF